MTTPTKGHMIWKDKRIPVRDVVTETWLDAEGARDGWNATGDDVIASQMFFPADMFTFEPEGSS